MRKSTALCIIVLLVLGVAFRVKAQDKHIGIEDASTKDAGTRLVGSTTILEFHAVAWGGEAHIYYPTTITRTGGDTVFRSSNAPSIGYSPSYPAERIEIEFKPQYEGNFSAEFTVSVSGFKPAVIQVRGSATATNQIFLVSSLAEKNTGNVAIGNSADLTFHAVVYPGEAGRSYPCTATRLSGSEDFSSVNVASLYYSSGVYPDSIRIRYTPSSVGYSTAWFELTSPGFAPALIVVRGTGIKEASVKDETNLSSVFYPNPASSMLYVDHAKQIESLKIYDLLGNCVAASTESQIAISNLATGRYVVYAGNRSFPLVVAR